LPTFAESMAVAGQRAPTTTDMEGAPVSSARSRGRWRLCPRAAASAASVGKRARRRLDSPRPPSGEYARKAIPRSAHREGSRRLQQGGGVALRVGALSAGCARTRRSGRAGSGRRCVLRHHTPSPDFRKAIPSSSGRAFRLSRIRHRGSAPRTSRPHS
jgi:hypothetical protein